MDPPSDPPPLSDHLAAAITLAAAASATVANPTPTQASAQNHPPYAEMITTAVSALNERDGSSKRAIAKYIESQYSVLPPDALLTYHLKRLRTNGQLLMVKYSYKLPGSAPAPVNGSVDAVPSDPAPSVPKRRPGRPPKPKPDSVQVAVPVFEPLININDVPVNVLVAEPTQPNVSVEPVNGPVVASVQPKRGRGRPPKSGGLKRGPGRPPASGVVKRGPGRPPASGEVKRGPGRPPASGEVKRGPGRPPASGEVKQGPDSQLESGSSGGPVRRGRGRPKAAAAPAHVPVPVAQVKKGPGRPRGRPPKPIKVVEGLVPPSVPAAPGVVGGVAPVVGKRRGRPPQPYGEAKRPRIVRQPKKPRQLSGKPLGRPRKYALATPANRGPDSHLLVAYLDLKAKLENLQSKISQTANMIKPSLTNEAAVNALQELELIAMNVITPPSAAAVAQNQPPQPQPEQQLQPEQYPQQPES